MSSLLRAIPIVQLVSTAIAAIDGLTIHIASNIALLTIAETTIVVLNIINNGLYGTSQQFREG